MTLNNLYSRKSPCSLESKTPFSHVFFVFLNLLVLSLSGLETEMATHSSVLAWRIPGVGEPGGLLSVGSHRVRHDWSDLAAAAAVSLDSPCSWKWKWKSLSCVWLFATPWTTAHQAPLSMGFSRQEYWSGVPLYNNNVSCLRTVSPSWKPSD